jgi:HlyD family secretion protein
VFLVTAAVSHVWRVTNGAAFKGASPYHIFVVRNGKAIRRTVHSGLSNFDYIEIKDNIQAGDVVITSDMSEFKNAQEIVIRN